MIEQRIAELQKQKAKLNSRKRLDSRDSAVAKRKQKIEREIEHLEQQREADRRRRMLLLIAAAA